MNFKFGDMVRNDWAGDINPHKVGMFIYYTTRKSGPFSKTRFAVFTKDGERWEHDASNEKLVVMGNVFDDLSGLREEIAMLNFKLVELETECSELNEDLIRVMNERNVAKEEGAEEMALLAFDEGFEWSQDGRESSTQPSFRRRKLEELMQLWKERKK